MATNWNDKLHNVHIPQLARMLDTLYKTATREAAALGVSLTAVDQDKLFSFDDYPATKTRLDKLLSKLRSGLTTTVEDGIRTAWTLANEKNDELCSQAMGKPLDKLTEGQRKIYLKTNDDARDAFIKRKEAGLNLSDRVWNYSTQFKQEIELALDLGIGQGKSADEMSRDLRQYLKYPDKLFRRVRDKHGNLRLSKAAAAFHPGQGVYRSSYKNALRLAATESNIAYRTADYLRWQDMDFVVGIEIEVSQTNHPVPDICDDLAGKYPKDFKFTGWHPHCRCHALTILKTQDEMEEDDRRIMRGEEPSSHSVNEVREYPDAFIDWVKNNEERITTAKANGTLPYFIRDNSAAVEGILNPNPTIERAKARHDARTQAEIDEIKQRARERQQRHAMMKQEAEDALSKAKDYSEVEYSKLEQYIAVGDLDKMYAEAKAVAKATAEMKAKEQALESLIPDVHGWHKKFSLSELEGVYKAVEKTMAGWTSLSVQERAKKLRYEAFDYLGGNMKNVQGRYKTWEVSQMAYVKALRSTVQEYGRDIISRAKAGDLTEYLNEDYEKYILALMKYDYAAQTSLLTEAERREGKSAIKRYLSSTSINPQFMFYATIGGIYNDNNCLYLAQQYAPTYNGQLSPEELSMIQRFTNGSGFSNSWNLRHTSAMWADRYAKTIGALAPAEEKTVCKMIEDWSAGANYLIDKMERYEGITFRGLKDQRASKGATEMIDALNKAYDAGAAWENHASSSTSSRFDVAEGFDGTLIMIIHNRSGAWIDPISEYKDDEYEVMTKRGTKYRVLSPPQMTSRGYYVAELEEI